MSTTLFSGPLTGTFQPSHPLLISGLDVTLEWLAVTSAGPTAIEWYMEFSPDTTEWFRELAEEDAGNGVVAMPKVVRTFKENTGANLGNGTHRFDTEFRRKNQFARVQLRVSAGAAELTLTAPFGKSAS